MSKNSNLEASDFDALKKLGYEFENPQDEFSYQPDSGGLADGSIAKSEFGIDVDPDAESDDKETPSVDNPLIAIPGESSWSQNHRRPEELIKEASRSEKDEVLSTKVQECLHHHPRLTDVQISVHVERGVVTLSGEVPDGITKIYASDVVRALPGVADLYNELSILKSL